MKDTKSLNTDEIINTKEIININYSDLTEVEAYIKDLIKENERLRYENASLKRIGEYTSDVMMRRK
jgi:regulator of replication initiation timing